MSFENRMYLCGEQTPLAFAFSRQDYEMFEFLISHGARIITNQRKNYGESRWHVSYFCIAARFQDQQAMDILKRYHDPNSGDEPVAIGLYKIMLCSSGIIDATNFLINNDVDITICNCNDENVIIYAIEKISRRFEMIQVIKFYRSIGVEYQLPGNWHPFLIYRRVLTGCSPKESEQLFFFLISDGFFEILDEDKMMDLIVTIYNFSWTEYKKFITECSRSLVTRTKKRFPDLIENIKLNYGCYDCDDYESFYRFLILINS